MNLLDVLLQVVFGSVCLSTANLFAFICLIHNVGGVPDFLRDNFGLECRLDFFIVDLEL